MTIAGKRVLITGAGRGIGAALAGELTRRGARVGLLGLEPDRLKALAAECGGVWAEADVTDQVAVTSGTERIVTALGGLDVMVANAGISVIGTTRQVDPEAFARTVDVNLVGVFRTVQAALPHLIERRGYVLVISSLAAMTPTAGFAAYGASKAGAEAFANALRVEVAHLGVRVGSAHPCWIDTDMVRDAEADLSTFADFRAALPWPMRAVTPLPECVRILADAVDRRAGRVFVPRAAVLSHLGRTLISSRLVNWFVNRGAAKRIPELENHVEALGRSLAARAEAEFRG